MCILLWTTACAEQGWPLILLSNRDEFLHRPTLKAGFWAPPNATVYGGRDLARPERGTWLGISREGRFAGLTNIREKNSFNAISPISRGSIVSSFLTSSQDVDDWTREFKLNHIPGDGSPLDQVGGFSLVYGQLKRSNSGLYVDKIAVASNRSQSPLREDSDDTRPVDNNDEVTQGLSNSFFAQPWPKVVTGRDLLNRVVQNVKDGSLKEDEIINSCFDILNQSDLNLEIQPPISFDEADWMQRSIFIPSFDTHVSASAPASPLDAATEDSVRNTQKAPYGTLKQTIILIRASGSVRYVEQTLFDSETSTYSKDVRWDDIEFELSV